MISMGETIIKVEHISKEYRLGTIGGGTLKGDLQSVWARLRGKEDPNGKIGTAAHSGNDRFLALDDISFEVRKGEALGIIGHNGAGKSTLLKLLSRVTAPTSGTICYNGRIASMLEVGTGFHPELTGRENVYLNGAILGMTKAEIDRKFDQIVEFAEMEKFIDTPVKRYSSGMYVKLAFAVAAHLDSEIMVMDEVLAVGDMKFQQKCLGKMGDAANHEGRTVLYVSHNMNTIRQLCTRCIVLDHGKVIYDGDVEEAIQVYINHKVGQKTKLNFLQTPRHAYLPQNPSIRMTECELLNASGSSIKQGGKLRFRVSFEYRELLKNNEYLRIEIRNGSNGVCAAFSACPLCANKNTVEYELDTSNVVPRQYSTSLVVFRYLNNGVIDIDAVKAFDFDIESGASSLCNWNYALWGNILLPNFEEV